MDFLPAEAEKRRFALRVLWYSPVWMAVIGLVQVTKCFSIWRDAGHMALGAGLALPLWALPWVLGPAEVPLGQRYATKATVFIGLLAFIQNDFGAQLFFNDLGMQYHFPVRLVWHGTPLFLYFLTVAYFSTYYVVLSCAWRAFRTAWPDAPRPVAALVMVLMCYFVAFGETYFMANDRLKEFFSYADKAKTLWVGSICYGTLFLITLPLFHRIDADGERTPLAQVAWQALGANTLVLLSYEIYEKLLF